MIRLTREGRKQRDRERSKGLSQGFDEKTTLHRGSVGLGASSARFLVEVVEGPDQGASVGIEPLLPSRVLVGKSEACSLRLSDPHASRRHAALAVHGS